MKKAFKATIFVLALIIMFSGFVIATPGVPQQFYGTVTTNGHPAADGVIITAKMHKTYANCDNPVNNLCPVSTTVTQDGNYGNKPDIFYVLDPRDSEVPPLPERKDQPIYFYVGDELAYIYNSFTNAASTELNLVATGDFPTGSSSSSSSSSSSGSSSSSSSGSSGGGSSSSSTSSSSGSSSSSSGSPIITGSEDTGLITTDPIACTPEWECSDWVDCVNGKQKRICFDTNKCGTDENRPAQEQSCEIPTLDDVKQQDNFFNKITGAVTGGGVGTWATLIIVLAIIAGLFLYGTRKRRIKKN